MLRGHTSQMRTGRSDYSQDLSLHLSVPALPENQRREGNLPKMFFWSRLQGLLVFSYETKAFKIFSPHFLLEPGSLSWDYGKEELLQAQRMCMMTQTAVATGRFLFDLVPLSHFTGGRAGSETEVVFPILQSKLLLR